MTIWKLTEEVKATDYLWSGGMGVEVLGPTWVQGAALTVNVSTHIEVQGAATSAPLWGSRGSTSGVQGVALAVNVSTPVGVKGAALAVNVNTPAGV